MDKYRMLFIVLVTFDVCWSGQIARDIDAWCQANGGLIRYDDLANHITRVEQPLRVEYRGCTVYKCGPWTQGPALLEALQILRGFDLQAMGFQSSDSLHVIVEAMKLAFADRDAYCGDPLYVDVPLDYLLSEEYARTRRTLIDVRKASLEVRPGDLSDRPRPQVKPPTANPPHIHDTTTCLAADRWGNVIAATPSGWGGVLVGDTGIRLGSRLISLNTQRGHPNCIQPGKRPRTTLTPTIVLKAGKPVLAVSVAGGDTQDQASLQIVTNFIEFGLDAAGLVATPRYATEHYIGSFNQRPPILDGLTIEPRVGENTIESLRQRGHRVNPANVTGQERTVIVIDPGTGVMTGAGDPEAVPARAATSIPPSSGAPAAGTPWSGGGSGGRDWFCGSAAYLSYSTSKAAFWFRVARRSRQERLTIRSASSWSTMLPGHNPSSSSSLKQVYSSRSSACSTAIRAKRPCLTAFWATLALPSGVHGPVDFWALERLAVVGAALTMMGPSDIDD